MSFSNPILWHRGHNLTANSEPRKSSRGVYETFFSWFSDHSNPGQDDVAQVQTSSPTRASHVTVYLQNGLLCFMCQSVVVRLVKSVASNKCEQLMPKCGSNRPDYSLNHQLSTGVLEAFLPTISFLFVIGSHLMPFNTFHL